jgi:pyruvate ferredoxin oxidoreductase gamma subunit
VIEIRWHGRGGQGAWTASLLLAQSALIEGKYVQSFPEFGPERMGAPIRAYTRVSDETIDVHSGVYEPGIAVVLYLSK